MIAVKTLLFSSALETKVLTDVFCNIFGKNSSKTMIYYTIKVTVTTTLLKLQNNVSGYQRN